MAEHRRKLQHTRELEQRRVADRMTHAPRSFHLQTLHVEAGTLSREQTDRVLRKLRMRRAPEILDAHFFVTHNPAKPGAVLAWCGALNGSVICNATYLESSGAQGSCVAYKKAISVTKCIWVSPSLATEDAVANSCLQHFLAAAGCQWVRLGLHELAQKAMAFFEL